MDVRFGWALESFAEDADGVDATLRHSATGERETLRCAYLAGCDGGGSVVRQQAGIALEGAARVANLFMIHFRSQAPDRRALRLRCLRRRKRRSERFTPGRTSSSSC